MAEPFDVVYIDPAIEDRPEWVGTVPAGIEALISVVTAVDDEGRIFEEKSVDSVVSVGELSWETERELIEAVDAEFGAVPFVLYAKDPPPDILQSALAAGLTEYVPRQSIDRAEWEFLLTRVEDAVLQARRVERGEDLRRILQVIRDLNRELVHADTQAAVDRRVCELISQSDPYRFAWIGEHDPKTQTVVPRESAGIEKEYLDEIKITTDPAKATAQGPTGKAVRTETIHVMQNIPENPEYEPWREAAMERGYRSSAAIPLVHQDQFYGVLNVYADRTDAFDDRELTFLDKIGSDIAHTYADIAIRETFETLFESIRDMVFVHDPSGDILSVNSSAAETLEYNRSELESLHMNAVHPPSEAMAIEDYDLQEGDERLIESQLLTESGEYIDVEVSLSKTEYLGENAILGVARDVTEKKKAQREVRAQKNRYEAVVENIHDALLIVQDREITYANQQITELAGYRPEEITGRTIETVFAPEDHSKLADIDTDRPPSDEQIGPREVAVRSTDGEHVPVELRVGFLIYEGAAGAVLALRDVTEREDRLEHLRVLDRVLRHNLQNDMTVIQGYAETIRDGAPRPYAGYAAEILTQSRDLLRTVSKERDIVEVIAHLKAVETTDIVNVTRDVADMLRESHPDATIELSAPEEATAKATDTIDRALKELVENAILHTKTDTPIVSVTVERTSDTVTIRVADTGPGIPPEERDVLTREREIEPLYHGSGLGLWLVNWIVRRSNGSITFTENEPRGSIITIELPAD